MSATSATWLSRSTTAHRFTCVTSRLSNRAPGLRFGAVTRDGKEVVFGMTLSRLGENAKNVVDAVKDKVAIVREALPDGVVLKPIYERTDLVEKAVSAPPRTR